MKLVLHVGFHKTGTSSAQRFCRENRDQLAAEGILYPKAGMRILQNPSTPSSEAGHRAFSDVLVTPANSGSRKVIEAMLEEAKKAGDIHTIFVSSETFSAPRIKISTSIMEVLQKHFSEVKILVYLRRQDDWADSFYREVLCWSGKREKRSFDRFKAEFLPEWLDYAARLAKWEELFGLENIIVRSYDDRARKNVIEDILANLGLTDIDDERFTMPGASNPTLSADLVPMMIDINRTKLGKEQRSLVTNRIFEALLGSEHFVDLQPVLDENLKQQFKEEFREKNIALCNHYRVENFEYLTYAQEKPRPQQEISLTGQQVAGISQYADELSSQARAVGKLDLSRPDQGRVGISCLLNEDPEQVKIFVAYHLALGVTRIRLYFDNPNDPMIDYDYGNAGVEAVPCDSDFWQKKIGREPANNGEKLSTCHKDGLNHLNKLDDIDWAINLDADELLYVDPATTLAEFLASTQPKHNQIKVRPLEAVFVDDADSQLFSARYFKVPRLNVKNKPMSRKKGIKNKLTALSSKLIRQLSSFKPLRWLVLRRSATAGIWLAWSDSDEALYRKHKPVMSQIMRDGFLAHKEGRMFTRHGIELDQVTSHKPKSSHHRISIKHPMQGIYVLHYDAADFAAWHLKWHRRIYGETTAAAIHDKRRMQQDMFRDACEQGDDALHHLFDDFFVFSPDSVDAFENAGLIVKLELPLIEQIKQQVSAA